jgi:hypothetical protein
MAQALDRLSCFYETERPEAVYASSFARMLSGAPNESRGLIALLDGPEGLVPPIPADGLPERHRGHGRRFGPQDAGAETDGTGIGAGAKV